MSKKLIVANWKMHFNVGQSSLFLHKLQEHITAHQGVEVVLCPSFLALQPLSLQINHLKFKLGAQNCYFQDEGAYTGEVSANMLRGLVKYAIIGHSERRHVFNEHDKDIAKKVQAALRNGIKPILCVGETRQERADNETAAVIHAQITGGLANVTSEEISKVVIAYEPVWAIGTGDFAKPDDVAESVKLIRQQVKAMFGLEASQSMTVLYGGSSDADNAAAYLQLDIIGGLLVGGASLKAPSFAKIVQAAHNSLKKV